MKYPSDWSDEYSKQGLCGVLAVAMTAGITIQRANQVLSQHLEPHQRRHVRATYPNQIKKSLKYLGRKISNYEVERMTLRRFIENHTERGVTYLILVTGHAVTVRDGIVADQVQISHILDHNSKRKFVKEVIEVY